MRTSLVAAGLDCTIAVPRMPAFTPRYNMAIESLPVNLFQLNKIKSSLLLNKLDIFYALNTAMVSLGFGVGDLFPIAGLVWKSYIFRRHSNCYRIGPTLLCWFTKKVKTPEHAMIYPLRFRISPKYQR